MSLQLEPKKRLNQPIIFTVWNANLTIRFKNWVHTALVECKVLTDVQVDAIVLNNNCLAMSN